VSQALYVSALFQKVAYGGLALHDGPGQVDEADGALDVVCAVGGAVDDRFGTLSVVPPAASPVTPYSGGQCTLEHQNAIIVEVYLRVQRRLRDAQLGESTPEIFHVLQRVLKRVQVDVVLHRPLQLSDVALLLAETDGSGHLRATVAVESHFEVGTQVVDPVVKRVEYRDGVTERAFGHQLLRLTL